MSDFYEDDEDPQAIRETFDAGPKGVTAPPASMLRAVEFEDDDEPAEVGIDLRAALDAAQDEIERLLVEIATLRAAGDSPGVGMIAEERSRQVIVEGYTREHDAEHGARLLSMAAMAYTVPRGGLMEPMWQPLRFWPWRSAEFKPSSDRVRDLTKAGALIAAAIDVELAARDGGGT